MCMYVVYSEVQGVYDIMNENKKFNACTSELWPLKVDTYKHTEMSI